MRFLTDPIVRTSKDLAALSSRLIDDGIGFLRSMWNSIPIFAGTQAHVGEEGCVEDETHYFLIPFRHSPSRFALGTMRVLPEGVLPENDLPKRKVFHVPDAGGEEILRSLLRAEIAGKNLEGTDAESEMADFLERVSAEIDEKSKLVTGGMLVIGGAVAFANPVAGVAIAGKALLPSIGAIFSREGIKRLVSKFRDRSQRKAEASVESAAAKEVGAIRAEVRENGILALLAQAISTEDPGFDPTLASLELPVGIPEMRIYGLTAEAVDHVYGGILGNRKSEEEAGLGEVDAAWVRGLNEYVAG